MVQSAPAQKYPSLPPALTVPQSSPRYPEVVEPQHALACFASHARLCRAAWQGRFLRPPVASLQSRGFPPHAPWTGASPLRPYQGAFVPLWNPDQGFSHPWTTTRGLTPLDPCAGGRSRAAGVFRTPEPHDPRGISVGSHRHPAPWNHCARTRRSLSLADGKQERTASADTGAQPEQKEYGI